MIPLPPPNNDNNEAAAYYPPAPDRPTLSSTWLKHHRAVRRRLLPMLVTAGAVMGLALLAAFFWPPTYRSTGTILIEQQEMPEDFVRSAITSYADQRIQVISQRVMTSSNLLDIIGKYDLYPEARRTKAREAIVADMRNDIKLEMISADVMDPRQGRATKATIAFSVSFVNRSPQVAAAVANELTSLYLRENLESRKQQAEGTADFLNTEAARIGRPGHGIGTEFGRFQGKNANSLPEYAQLNLQLASRAQDDMRELDSRVRALDQQIVFSDAQLAQINPTATLYGDTGQRVMGAKDQLKILKTQYAAAVANYSDTHPDVVRLKSEIEGLERNSAARAVTATCSGELDQAQSRSGGRAPDAYRRAPRRGATHRPRSRTRSAAEKAPPQTPATPGARRTARQSGLYPDPGQPRSRAERAHLAARAARAAARAPGRPRTAQRHRDPLSNAITPP